MGTVYQNVFSVSSDCTFYLIYLYCPDIKILKAEDTGEGNSRDMGPLCSIFYKPKSVLKIKILIFNTKTKKNKQIWKKNKAELLGIKVEISRLDLDKDNWIIDLKKLFNCRTEKKGE